MLSIALVVYHFSDRCREHEKGNDSIAGAPRSCHHRWLLLAPWPVFKAAQRLISHFGIDGLINRLERSAMGIHGDDFVIEAGVMALVPGNQNG